MASNNKSIKCRNIMYEQQLRHLPEGTTLQNVMDLIEAELSPSMIAGVLHDKDVKEDGITPVEPHIHIMMRFENARSIRSIAKAVGDNPQQFEAWHRNFENGFSYLIHATDNARYKHQYDASEVLANFDFVALIKEVGEKVQKIGATRSSRRIETILNLVANGEMTIRDARIELSGAEYAKASQLLNKAHEKYLARKAEELREELKKKNQTTEAYWIYGDTGCGKSRLAKYIASKEGEFYISTTQKDPFQFYSGQPIIVLDELRPSAIEYSELLAILDPFSFGDIKVSSRYSNKVLAAKMFIITTPYSPTYFHSEYKLPLVDRGTQLYRRLTTVLKMTNEKIIKMEYDDCIGMYIPVAEKENKYSQTNENIIIGRDLFSLI